MDFSTFKPGQLACVTTLDKPLAVSAGAGSGKTFTLTQRIAWALMEGSASDGGRFLNSIDEVLAITFTDKAAGEIKARVKRTLKAEGLAAEAAKMDGAWISTIHGMCARILRSHALELGIDPAFQVLDEAGANRLIEESIEQVLKKAKDDPSSHATDTLFAEYSARRSGGGFGGTSIESMVRTLVERASASPQGCACIEPDPPARPAGVLVRGLVQLIEELYQAVLAQKPSSRRDTWLASADVFIKKAQTAFECGAIDEASLISLFSACPSPHAGFGSKDYKEFAKDMQGACAALVDEAKILIARPLVASLVELTASVYAEFRRRKEALCVLDNNDLLIYAARALRDNPDLAQEFANRFKLIMVDEFQDTDQIQTDMIALMAGQGTCRLCTVGDAQQSIYRFRGADVAVYKRRLAAVQELNPQGLIVLPDNFRSHGDVLCFVDVVFGQPQVFGSEFMSLTASRTAPKQEFKGDRRIDVLFTTVPRVGGIGTQGAHVVEAARIARRFAELRDAGHAAGDMALLLGRMSNAGVYAEALRREGFSCVIAGGSVFARAPEVRIMLRLAQVIANPKETVALFEVLSSEMFALSADDFLELSTCFDAKQGVYVRRSLDTGFFALEQAVEAGKAISPQLAFVARLLRKLVQRAGSDPTSAIMADAVRDAGWLARLEARGSQGQAVAGNIMKTLRLVEHFEKEGAAGPAQVAQLLAAHIEASKEAPGALSARGGDFVKIMTVHASKGLEFPIVAVAEMGQSRMPTSAFYSATVEGRTYITLKPKRSIEDAGGIWGIKAKDGYSVLPTFEDGAEPRDIIDASDPLERQAALRAYETEQDVQERRRLMYVAFTRAQEALIFACTTKRRSTGYCSGAGEDIYDDVRSALFGEEDVPEGVTRVDFGGEVPAYVERIDADEELLEACTGVVADESAAMLHPVAPSDSAAASNPAITSDPAIPLNPAVPSHSAVASHPATMSNSAALSEPAAATFDIPILPDDERWEEVPWRDSRHGVTSYTALAEEQLQQEELTWAATQPDQSTQPVQPTQAQGFASQEKGADRNAAIPNFTDSLSSEIRFSDDEDDIFWEALTESFLVDADKASNLGTAFHLLARCAVSGGRGVLMPTDERISCIAQRCGLGEDAQRRLHAALERWTASEIAASLAHYASIQPETPFFVLIDDTPTAPEDTISQTPTPMNDGGLEGSGGSEEDWQTSAPGLFDSTSWQGEVRDSAKRKSQKTDTPAAAEPLYLEGAIDLLAYDERGQGRALVVDYKTGGHEQESAEQLQAKHALQASCYAYAVLRQGFARVEVVFVRVERPNPAAPDQPQCVCYTFEASQLPALAASIRTAHYSSKSA